MAFVYLVQRRVAGDLCLGVLPILLLWILRPASLRRSELYILRANRFGEVLGQRWKDEVKKARRCEADLAVLPSFLELTWELQGASWQEDLRQEDLIFH